MVLSAHVDVLAQADDVVGVGQLLEYDAVGAVLGPHPQELGHDQHQRQVQTDDSATHSADKAIVDSRLRPRPGAVPGPSAPRI